MGTWAPTSAPVAPMIGLFTRYHRRCSRERLLTPPGLEEGPGQARKASDAPWPGTDAAALPSGPRVMQKAPVHQPVVVVMPAVASEEVTRVMPHP